MMGGGFLYDEEIGFGTSETEAVSRWPVVLLAFCSLWMMSLLKDVYELLV